jgi:hypothetical protein
MKKTLRKLNLSRETLRALNDGGLGQAAGGHSHKPRCFSADTQCTGNTCDCTLGCNTVPCTTA